MHLIHPDFHKRKLFYVGPAVLIHASGVLGQFSPMGTMPRHFTDQAFH